MNSSTPAAANTKGDLPNPFQSPPHRAVLTLFHCLAIVFTIARLTRRIRIRRFSWDDACAGVCLLLIVIYMAVAWTKLKMDNEGQPGDLETFRKRLETMYKLNLAMYAAIVWISRVSLSLSIARIFPPGRIRLTAIILSIVCLGTGIVLVMGKTIACRAPLSRPSPADGKPRIACTKAIKTFFIVQTVGDILSSVALVIFPIRALIPNTSELHPSERRLVLVLLMSTTVALAMCLATAVFISKSDLFRLTLFLDLEESIGIPHGLQLPRRHNQGAEEEETEDSHDHGVDYNTGEDPLSIPTSRGLRSGNATNNIDTVISSGRTNTTTTSRFSTVSALTDIADISFGSMELVGRRSELDSHSNH
ncbi:hypothetical protein E1B28_009696 [Marasmius oreades]|uniref:Rhodopsin domain-containing protein n=1 Tax=Marasmius oreades TaxID=181124 RepID=A0A9P7RWQ0_9AGAR|nr:uncharacterized protein E1B28_009696 [Marasmius oreades]KAG7090591.1 hypothetical protein E1B28_009696 [Marasmius oreades]